MICLLRKETFIHKFVLRLIPRIIILSQGHLVYCACNTDYLVTRDQQTIELTCTRSRRDVAIICSRIHHCTHFAVLRIWRSHQCFPVNLYHHRSQNTGILNIKSLCVLPRTEKYSFIATQNIKVLLSAVSLTSW